jgi:hypothetical protein
LDHEHDHQSSSDDDLPLQCFHQVQTTDCDMTDLFDLANLTEATSDNNDDTVANTDIAINAVIRLPCVAHSLQLVLKDAIKTPSVAEKVLKECNSVVLFSLLVVLNVRMEMYGKGIGTVC